MQKKIMIMPSLLAGDFGNLEASARKAEACGGDALHMDIMDAHFVPNLSMGPDVVRMARRCLGIPLNVHLMMTHPHLYVRAFIEAGASTLLIHVEAQCDIRATLRQIRDLGAAPGLAINPETPVSALFPWLDEINEVLFMTVHPGFGGQAFIRPNSQDAVREFRPYFDVAPVYGHGPSLEEFTELTPLTVGSPQQVIDRYAAMREHVGDYQRQLFLIDHAGLPRKTVLEQIEILGTEIVPVLRRELDALRPAHVPDAPTHAARVAARGGSRDATVRAAADDVTDQARHSETEVRVR